MKTIVTLSVWGVIGLLTGWINPWFLLGGCVGLLIPDALELSVGWWRLRHPGDKRARQTLRRR